MGEKNTKTLNCLSNAFILFQKILPMNILIQVTEKPFTSK